MGAAMYLDGSWHAESAAQGLSITGSVPGDVLTDLERASVIGDPLYEMNWLQKSSLWQGPNWEYSTTFSVSSAALERVRGGSQLLLVFEGIKMGAHVSVNNVSVGTATDQFLRYEFALDASVVQASNEVRVTFDTSIDVQGRFMACTGGWDWAPYTDTKSSEGATTFSRGIWKSVYVVEVGAAAITHLVPHTFYQGEYPTAPLKDGEHGGFLVTVRSHFYSPSGTQGTLQVSGSWGESNSAAISIPAGESNFTVNISAPADKIKLWWPNGVGPHPMFHVSATFTPSTSSPLPQTTQSHLPTAPISASRPIGFRFFALVTGNDTDPTWVQQHKDGDGSANHGMYFRVNGAAIMSLGGNMIPLEELEGRQNSTAYVEIVRSASAANFNTLRVWGGGIFLPDVFYDTCDAEGILLYHDMQFAQQGHSPAVTDTQRKEFEHQVRRLGYHPSVAIFDGCNECVVENGGSTGIYATFVLTVVAGQDSSRVLWPSCPAHGWQSGVNTLTGAWNGKPLVSLGTSGSTKETHGPYQHGGSDSHPAVNGDNTLSPFSSNIPPTFTPGPVGIDQPNVFASEFGGVVMSSFESMSPTLAKEHWSVHGGAPGDTCTSGFAKQCKGDNVMAQRNYPVDNFLSVYFGGNDSFWNTTGEFAFQRQLYHSLIGQALELSSNILTRRSGNQFGIIVWQYGEIWPTGGWGSVEYSTPREGQVVGGRWKPLQHFYKQYLYAPVVAACGTGNQCFVRNDLASLAFNGSVEMSVVDLNNGTVTPVVERQVALAQGPGATEFFHLNHSVDATNEILQVIVTDASGSTISVYDNLFAVPGSLNVQPSNAKASVASSPNPDGSIDVTVTADNVAVFTTLTTAAQGRFSTNAFLLVPPSATVQFIPIGPLDRDLLAATLRVEDVSTYQ